MNQKPKILIFSVFFDPVEGGAEIALRQLISELADAYDFHIITARLSKYAVAYEQRSYATIHRVGTGRFTIDKYFYTYFAKRHVRKFFVDGGIVFDMVYGLLENQAALVALDIGRKHKKPILIGLQSGDTEKEIRRFLGPFSFLYDKVYSKDAQYAVLSTYLRQRALSHGVSQERIHVIPNGVNISVFTKKPDATEVAKIKRDLHLEPFTIVTTSRLVKKNAIDDLIRAFVIV
ncbi:MAG TPA: glycosyltransferase, partial [Acidobacteriota bacterium]|nr:glycosyltransferase [Acidobacteriota bacterium]